MKWLSLIGACVLFGLLMALRDNLTGMWSRALIAAVAVALIGVAISLKRESKEQHGR